MNQLTPPLPKGHDNSDKHYLLSFFAHFTGAILILGFIVLRLVALLSLGQKGSALWLVFPGDIMLIGGIILLFGRQGLARLRQATYRLLLTFKDEWQGVYKAISHDLWLDLTSANKKTIMPPPTKTEEPPPKSYIIVKRRREQKVPETVL